MGVLAGSLLSPVAQATRSPLAQDEPKPKAITFSGVAILPDGGAAANLPVAVREWTRVVSHDDPVLARATTDAAGRFAIKFDHGDRPYILLEIGDKMKSAWIIKPVQNKAKDVELGRMVLLKKVG